MKIFYIFTLTVLFTLTEANKRKKRFLNEAWWSQFHSGVSQLEGRAGQVGEGLSGWAEKVEDEMRPAIDKLGHELGGLVTGLVDSLVLDNPLFKHEVVDRQDGVGVISSNAGVGVRSPSHQIFTTSFTSDMDGHFGSDFGGLFGGGLERDDSSQNVFDPFRIFGLVRKPWYQGENVCTEREIIDEESSKENIAQSAADIFSLNMKMTSCQEQPNVHQCTTTLTEEGVKKTIVVKHFCCHGFKRASGGTGACEEQEMGTLKETVLKVGGVEFLALLEDNQLMDTLDESNFTLFVPSDEAIEDFHRDLLELNEIGTDGTGIDDGLVERKKRDLSIEETPRLQDILLSHIVEGIVSTSMIEDEEIVETLAEDYKGMRMSVYNTWPTKVVMANCAKVVSRDNMAEGGLVHLVDKVVVPPKHDLQALLAEDLRLTQFSAALAAAGLMEKLQEAPDSRHTIFAPTNQAMDRLDAALKARLVSGGSCAEDILKRHISPNFICSGVVEEKSKTNNIADKYLVLERSPEGDFMVEGVKVVMSDMIATNGIVHVIEDVLEPESARSVPEKLTEMGQDTFKELLEVAGMTADDLDNVTLFLPTEKALGELPAGFLTELKSEPEKLQEFLHYHMARPKRCKCELYNDMMLSSQLEDKEIRVNRFGSRMLFGGLSDVTTAQCSKLTSLDNEVCGGMMHMVERVLIPPAGDVVQVLRSSGDHAKFLELLEFTGMEEELANRTDFTLLVPTDQAFDDLETEQYEKLFEDQAYAESVLLNHMLGEVLCCAGISRNNPFLNTSLKRSLRGELVSVKRSPSGHLYAGKAALSKCDIMATNAVIHQVDKVMLGQGAEEVSGGLSRMDSLAHIFRINPFKLF